MKLTIDIDGRGIAEYFEEADEMYRSVCSLIGGEVFRVDRPVDHMVTAKVRY